MSSIYGLNITPRMVGDLEVLYIKCLRLLHPYTVWIHVYNSLYGSKTQKIWCLYILHAYMIGIYHSHIYIYICILYVYIYDRLIFPKHFYMCIYYQMIPVYLILYLSLYVWI